MFSNGNSYGVTNATDLGECASDTGARPVSPTPRWFLAVTVWRPRPGK